LDSWPALPLSVWYDSDIFMSSGQMADVAAAFEHSDRIREISLPAGMVYDFFELIHNKSFPELEHLALSEFRFYFFPIFDLHRDFLGGSNSPRRLRNIFLDGLYLPALPQLLLSSRDLISLHLGHSTLTRVHFISPKVLSHSLSATTQLEYLYIDCLPIHTEFNPELTSQNSPPLDLIVLPALAYFRFGGFIEYMENLVYRIHAPHLEKLDVRFDQHVLDIPQLSQFISRTKRLSSLPFRTSISLDMGGFSIRHHFGSLSSLQEGSHVCFRCVDTGDWQVSQVEHICTQLSQSASSVKQLKISAFHLPPNLQRKTDPAPWVQLLTPYNSVEEIECRGKGAPCTGIAYALKQSIGETAQELLPVLRVLRIHGFHSWSIRLTEAFLVGRKRTGRPVIIRRLTQKNQDTDWEAFESDMCRDGPV